MNEIHENGRQRSSEIQIKDATVRGPAILTVISMMRLPGLAPFRTEQENR